MKKILYPILGLMIIASGALKADVETQDLGPSEIPPEEAQQLKDEKHPFKFDILADYVAEADTNRCACGKNVTFGTAIAELNFVFYYKEEYKEGAAIGLSYIQTYLDYRDNPFFNQKNYETVRLLFSTFTSRLCNWEWQAQVGIYFDDLPYWTFNDYMYYDITAWGRYAYSQCVGLHIGFLAQTGMKVDRVYPIVGFDWQINDRWKINAVYPVNISAVYTINTAWNVEVAARFLDQRHRTKRDEPLPEAIWHYQTAGTEFGVNYNPNSSFSLNLHGGYSMGGHLKIANRNYHRRERIRIEGAPYGGGEVIFNF